MFYRTTFRWNLKWTGNLTLPKLFLNKNIVFPAQAEYSYFSADLRVKIWLLNILRLKEYKLDYVDTTSDYLSYHDFDGVKVILKPNCRQ